MNFDKDYWLENYSEPESMDGMGNAKDHALYLKKCFELDLIDISSVIDFGAGYGVMFKELVKTFIPYKAMAIEPSSFAYQKLSKKKITSIDSVKLNIQQKSIQQWCKDREQKKDNYDLGVLMSVLQYIPSKDIDSILEVLAQKVKYLYLTVPTDKELSHQREKLEFVDRFALSRSRTFYRRKISRHFTNISSKLWESKFYFNEETTLFTDLLYRS